MTSTEWFITHKSKKAKPAEGVLQPSKGPDKSGSSHKSQEPSALIVWTGLLVTHGHISHTAGV